MQDNNELARRCVLANKNVLRVMSWNSVIELLEPFPDKDSISQKGVLIDPAARD